MACKTLEVRGAVLTHTHTQESLPLVRRQVQKSFAKLSATSRVFLISKFVNQLANRFRHSIIIKNYKFRGETLKSNAGGSHAITINTSNPKTGCNKIRTVRSSEKSFPEQK